MISCLAIACLVALALRRIDHPEAAIEAALLHPRQIHLGEFAILIVTLKDVPSRAMEIGRRIEVRIQDDGAFMQLPSSRRNRFIRLRIEGKQHQTCAPPFRNHRQLPGFERC